MKNNIYGGSNDQFLAALTFPTTIAFRKGKLTKQYPVMFRDKLWPSAESAYQFWKKWCENYGQMRLLFIDIAYEKFLQYPELLWGVDSRGGVEWLENCCHWTGTKETFYQGSGAESAFIRYLVEAYEQARRDFLQLKVITPERYEELMQKVLANSV